MTREVAYKEACEVIRAHYQVNTKSPRKLLKLFPHDGEKNESIIAEAKRILELRESLGVSQTGSVCEMCERYGSSRSVCRRHGLVFKIDDRRAFNGWKKWSINKPILCQSCYYRARSVVAQYLELIELYRLCQKLIKTEQICES